jgi:hypothetical protein
MTISRRPSRQRSTEDEDVSLASVIEEQDDDALPPQGNIRSGWSAAKQQMDASSDFVQSFKPEQNIQVIKFLDDAPYANFRRHWIERMGPQGKVNRPYICFQTIGKDCPVCKAGDKPQSVSAFNVALIGDDGVPLVKSWDVGAKIFNVLANFHNDPKIGPLTKGYFAVSKVAGQGSGARRGGTTQTNVIPAKPSSLEEDYSVIPPSSSELAALEKYSADDIKLPKRSDMEEIAEELATDYD